MSERQKVWVKATLTPAVPGVTVYFRLFDVDDPSGSLVIDTNGAVGEDNTGLKSAWLASAVTDASGVARAGCSVSLYPGDNWRAVASCIYGALEVADAGAVEYGLDPAGCKVSKKLTTWRRLWYEFDSMAAPLAAGIYYDETNFVQRCVLSIARQYDDTLGKWRSTVDLTTALPGEEGQFETGHISFGDGATFPIVLNPLLWRVEVDGYVPDGYVGWSVDLYDDDWVVPASPLTGPETLKRPMPYALSGGGTMLSAFATAHIYVTPVPPSYTQAPTAFQAHLSEPSADGKNLSNSEAFWYTHMLASWQGRTTKDMDPVSEVGTLGMTYVPWFPVVGRIPYDYGNIFVEVVRENENDPSVPRKREAVVVTHEIGHTRGLSDHPDPDGDRTRIMHPDAPFEAQSFTEKEIKHMREAIVPRMIGE